MKKILRSLLFQLLKLINLIDQFRYIKIQPKTIDFNTRLLGINHHKLCSYSHEPRTGVYCVTLNFNISKLVYCICVSKAHDSARNIKSVPLQDVSFQFRWCFFFPVCLFIVTFLNLVKLGMKGKIIPLALRSVAIGRHSLALT